MQIKRISSDLPEKIDLELFKPQRINQADEVKEQETNKIENHSNWQKNILLDALESLENNIQMDNTHPLDNPMNAPIETYKQALKELKFVKTEKFKNEALNAHSNLNIDNILSLFT